MVVSEPEDRIGNVHKGAVAACIDITKGMMVMVVINAID